MKMHLVNILAIITLLLMSGCATSTTEGVIKEEPDVIIDDEPDIIIQPQPTTLPASSTSQPTGQVREITMTAQNWEFIPSVIRVNEGDIVKLTISTIEGSHGLAIPDFGVNQQLNQGETVTVQFTADKKGTFTFFCNVPCGSGHRDMKGQLIVE